MKNFNIKIEYKNQKDVFILFSALNSMGYNDENNNQGMHPIRKKVRNYLLACNWSKKYPELNKIIKKRHPAQLLMKILQRLSISDFKKFSKEPLIQKLWTKFKNPQEKEIKKIFPSFQREVVYLIRFINKKPSDVKKIVLIINLLDAYWRGYGFKIAKTGYVIVGPGADKNQGELLRHELLHILAPNLRFPTKILPPSKSLVNMGYNNKKIIGREYIIRGLNLLYEEKILKNKLSKIIKREQREFPAIKEVLDVLEEKLKKKKGGH